MRGFVGRARELGDLGRELDAARSGPPWAVPAGEQKALIPRSSSRATA